ncbi:MAG: DGQHR domain-containing protein [Candidatus Micrarchaeaceae archaeon]
MPNEIAEEQDPSQLFQDEMKTFLQTIGCTNIHGGAHSNFNIAPKGQSNQIDVCGRFGKTLFIVECTASRRRLSGTTDLRSKIVEWIGKIRIAEGAYRGIQEYSDCDNIVPIFATKKYTLTESNKNLLASGVSGKKIIHVDENFLEYYDDVIDKIGNYAVFNILYEFGIRPSMEEKLIADAIKTNIKGFTCYLFYAKPRELLKFAYVARRNSRKEYFYQRLLNKSRLSEIRRFLNGQGNFFPTNVIISLKGHNKYFFRPYRNAATTSANIEVGTLEIRNGYATCWIIDGQHRLYSFAKSDTEFLLPCMAIEDPGFEKERDFFININKEQKPVPSDLIWDLEGEKDPDCRTDEGIISNAVKLLDEDSLLAQQEQSPFIGRIDMPSNEKKEQALIKISAFCNGIENAGLIAENLIEAIGGGNPLRSEDGRQTKNRLAKTVAKYFSMINAETPNTGDFSNELNSFLLGNTGVPIMLYVLQPIVARIGRIPNREDLRPYIRSAINYFSSTYTNRASEIKKLKQILTGEGARRDTAEQIGRHIKTQLNDDLFWPHLGNSDIYKRITKIERAVGDMIADKLYGIDHDWTRHRLPQGMREMIARHVRPETEFQDYLGLGDEKAIIAQNWDSVFSAFFTDRSIFQDKNELQTAFDVLSRNRAPWAHGRTVEDIGADLRICRGYIDKFEILLKDYIEEENTA